MPDAGSAPVGSTASRRRVLFIGGLGRSGTTLIERLINELPGTVAVGETVHLWERGVRDRERCGCGDPFDECEHWSEVGKRAFGDWSAIDLDRVIDLRWDVDRSRRLASIFRARRTGHLSVDQRCYLDHLRPIIESSADVAGADVVVDSSKHVSTAALLSLDPALDVRVLHVTRDPRGVAYSWTKAVQRPEASANNQAGSLDSAMPTYRPSRTAARWVSDNLAFDALAATGVPTLRLRYEDFLADPTAALHTIAGLAEIAVDHFPFLDGELAHLTTPMHSVAGNPLRFGGDDITLRLDDAWVTRLDSADARTVTRITSPVLRRYGYRRTP